MLWLLRSNNMPQGVLKSIKLWAVASESCSYEANHKFITHVVSQRLRACPVSILYPSPDLPLSPWGGHHHHHHRHHHIWPLQMWKAWVEPFGCPGLTFWQSSPHSETSLRAASLQLQAPILTLCFLSPCSLFWESIGVTNRILELPVAPYLLTRHQGDCKENMVWEQPRGQDVCPISAVVRFQSPADPSSLGWEPHWGAWELSDCSIWGRDTVLVWHCCGCTQLWRTRVTEGKERPLREEMQVSKGRTMLQGRCST